MRPLIGDPGTVSAASPATAMAVPVGVGVFRRELVAVLAMGPPRCCSSDVFLFCDGLEMFRIDAGGVVTEVVDLVADGNRPDPQFMGDPVGVMIRPTF